ncbi:MAG: hypothetical protein M3Z29_01205 [Pseudomonadota bacterium]|nr:hypothetical protein [Pseudomonadota bacterium]
MNSKLSAAAVLVSGCAFVAAAGAQTPMAGGASAAATSASMAPGKTKAKAPVARVTGGPGYVSEGSAGAASATTGDGSMPTTKKRARVTGGPGGTAGTPETPPGK